MIFHKTKETEVNDGRQPNYDEYYAQNLLCYDLPDPIDGYALVTVMNSGTAQYGQGYISGVSLFLNIAQALAPLYIFVDLIYLNRYW